VHIPAAFDKQEHYIVITSNGKTCEIILIIIVIMPMWHRLFDNIARQSMSQNCVERQIGTTREIRRSDAGWRLCANREKGGRFQREGDSSLQMSLFFSTVQGKGKTCEREGRDALLQCT
jgi:hypothetical protein